MPARIVGKPEYLPDPVWESVIRLHGAVDPETGHLTCHHYPIALQLVETGGGPVPALQVGECILIVAGATYISRLLAEAKDSRLEEIGADYALVSGVRVSTEVLAHVLSSLRDWKSQVKFYTLTLEIDGRARGAAVAVFQDQEGGWAAVLTDCERGGEESRSETLHL
ncbi:hypothetical protein APE_1284.1 [Aeropyrum pernix K1]|uniref:Uncharacterized protein n=1 Tax=Aeropyrum pernix (strain ATCC 700893 / DSM 11879 / JCM 9820 / NBRC 100138 / K1) TaxID=272557 RepID=Q9YCH3_AERPE|nr:hypothetical protein [Aeropyrum pernix]BAA80275.2 hypothetical protein APE_1284.1 [Aeropyrum pernix K1]